MQIPLPHDHLDTGSTESCGFKHKYITYKITTFSTSGSHGPHRPPGPKKGSWKEVGKYRLVHRSRSEFRITCPWAGDPADCIPRGVSWAFYHKPYGNETGKDQNVNPPHLKASRGPTLLIRVVYKPTKRRTATNHPCCDQPTPEDAGLPISLQVSVSLLLSRPSPASSPRGDGGARSGQGHPLSQPTLIPVDIPKTNPYNPPRRVILVSTQNLHTQRSQSTPSPLERPPTHPIGIPTIPYSRTRGCLICQT